MIDIDVTPDSTVEDRERVVSQLELDRLADDGAPPPRDEDGKANKKHARNNRL